MPEHRPLCFNMGQAVVTDAPALRPCRRLLVIGCAWKPWLLIHGDARRPEEVRQRVEAGVGPVGDLRR